MPAPEVFAWGCVGGAIVAAFLYVVPELARDLATTGKQNINARKILLMIVLTILFGAIAGVLTLIPSNITTRGKAIEAGLGIQATLRGILGAVQQGIRPPAADGT